MTATATEDLAALERRLARERAARKEAERLLEEKARELFEVNEKLRAQSDELTDTAKLRRDIMNSVGHAILTANDDGTLRFMNQGAQAMFGYQEEEVLGRDMTFLLPELGGLKDNATARRKDGTTFPADVAISDTMSDSVPVIIIIVRDLTSLIRRETERTELLVQLNQAQKFEAIGTLAGGIAHEINTPIQYIGDNLRFLGESCEEIAPVVDKLRRIAQRAKDAGGLGDEVDEVLRAVDEADLDYLLEELPTAAQQSLEGAEQVARIVTAMKEFSHPGTKQKTPTDLNRSIENALTVSRNEWKYVADLTLALDPDLPSVPCLPAEFNQVILNVVVNASHAIASAGGSEDSKGTITVGSARTGDWVEIQISDSGTGIPEDARDKIFDPFFTTKGVGKGTGQGLSIAHDTIVNKHGGELTFETETGRGTTFVIRLPIHDPDRQEQAA